MNVFDEEKIQMSIDDSVYRLVVVVCRSIPDCTQTTTVVQEGYTDKTPRDSIPHDQGRNYHWDWGYRPLPSTFEALRPAMYWSPLTFRIHQNSKMLENAS